MTDEHKIEPRPEVGRAIARHLTGDGANTSIAVDTDVIRAAAAFWSQRGADMRAEAASVAEFGNKARADAADFMMKYRPDGSYDGDYYAMQDGDEDVSGRLTDAADRADALAGGLIWFADSWEDIQSGAVKIVEEIDENVLAGTDAGTEKAADGATGRIVEASNGAADSSADDMTKETQPA